MAARPLMVSRSLALAIAGLLFTSAVPRVGYAQAAADARPHLTSAEKAAKSKDWGTAATEYAAANSIAPSALALEGLAVAQYQQKLPADAYASYDALLKTYGDKLSGAKKAAAEARLKELATQTGSLSIRVSEPEAGVSIDGKAVGKSPILGLVRVSIGMHRLLVSKEGYVPVEQQPNVAANATLVVDAQLAREAKTGHVSVKEKGGQPLRVTLDGVDVGPAPWEADLEPGPHDIAGRSPTAAAAPLTIEIVKGKSVDIELTAVATTAHLEVKVDDARAIVFLDGKPAAEGHFSGDVTPGPHTLVVSREGFDRFEKKLVMAEKDSVTETVTLKKSDSGAKAVAVGRSFEGLYGGFGLTGLILPSGSGNEIDTRCHEIGAASCDTPSPVGGGVFGYMGYSWNPVGLEVMLGGVADFSQPKATFAGETTPGGRPNANPLSTGAARTEDFKFARFGGIAAVRARVSFQTDRIRGSIAGGFGLSYKQLIMTREATSTDGRGLKDGYAPDGSSYVSPALTFDASLGWRFAETTSLVVGVLTWIENAGSDARAKGDLNRNLSGASGVAPISTPPYQMASGAQLFIGPYLGMQFGP